MPQLQVPLTEEEIDSLERYAHQQGIDVHQLVKEYLAYLLAGGDPVTSDMPDLPTSDELAKLAECGGSFDWLSDEPELYSLDDGQPA